MNSVGNHADSARILSSEVNFSHGQTTDNVMEWKNVKCSHKTPMKRMASPDGIDFVGAQK